MGEKNLKVLMLNGSPRERGNIALAFHEMEQVFDENGIEYENILLGRTAIRGCIACETYAGRSCGTDSSVRLQEPGSKREL